jgi:hypothetical protein
MKKIITTITLGLLFSLSSFATVWTVSNDPNRKAQFTNLNDAHTSASSFDTIYVYGSATQYPNASISKRLVIIGPGYNVQASNTNTAYFSDINLNGGSSNTILLGLVVNNIYPNSSSTINNILIRGCHLGVLTGTLLRIGTLTNSHSNWIIENCIIVRTNIEFALGNYNTTIIIRNNIIGSRITTTNPGVVSNNQIVIQNNLFIGANFNFGYIRKAIIKNNIFYDSSPSTSADSCAFINNITWDIPTGNQQNLPYGTNTGTGNLNMTDPLFVNAIDKNGLNFNNNFRLSSLSPAKNAGNDGTDIGPTGGVSPIYPTPTGQLTGMPPIPTITQMNLPVNAAPQGGNIQLFIRGKRNN